MKARSLGLAAAALVVCSGQAALAAVCADMSPPVVNAPAAAGAKCLSVMAKSGSKFITSKMNTESKRIMQFDESVYPNVDDAAKVIGVAEKSATKIASSCDEAALTALASSYNAGSAGGFTPAAVASCMLSQHNVEAKVMIGNSNGAPAAWSGPAERAKCASAVSKAANKYVKSVLKSVNRCVDGQTKAGTPGDLAPVCIGTWVGGVFTAPTDAKAAGGISKATDKAEGSIQKACGDNPIAASNIDTLFACSGAETADDLKNCIVCNNWGNLLNVFEQQYAETGSLVEPGPAALQTAVDAALVGDKLLVASGDYEEEVVLATDGLQLVGCGGATDNRPTITPPALPTTNRGIFAANTDNLLMQSLEPNGWAADGIFVTGAAGLTFRDIIADGEINSTYSIFPVESTDVVVEASEVTGVIDAGIYVGQTIGCTVRHNYVHGNIAGIEIENSQNCDVYGNLAKGNNAGILVFKLTAPALQISLDHDIAHNSSSANNFDGAITAPGIIGLVPAGVGFMVISTDTSDFHHNYAKDNQTSAFMMLDQEAVNALVGAIFDPPSVDQTNHGNTIRENQFAGNAQAPDTTPPNGLPTSPIDLTALMNDIVFALSDETNHNNCFTSNSGGNSAINSTSDCTP